jgi:2-dehydro-3-deoxyglucarate aldolase/4-hydroxy-2-oxoheptanedioate aldolase
MKDNPVKRTLASGGVSPGTMVFALDTPAVALLAAEAGAEWAVFDMEHSGWGFDTIRTLVAAAQPTTLTPLVRVPANERHFIGRALDVGASGVLVPMVHSKADAEAAVSSAYYPPDGERGAAFTMAHDRYTDGNVADKMRKANENVLVAAMIESAEAIANADEIASVEGVDVLWVGQFDLTSALGIPGQTDHPEYIAAVEQVMAACAAHGVAPGILAPGPESVEPLIAQGYRFLAYGRDAWIFKQGLREGIEAVRAAAGRLDK